MAAHNTLGKEGEEAAVAYLQGKGYFIRHRNWRLGKRELDIVAEKDNLIVVVEVKTRSTSYYGDPSDAVDDMKIRNIVSAADVYLRRFSLDNPVRFDIITIVGTLEHFVVEHIEEAFYPPIW